MNSFMIMWSAFVIFILAFGGCGAVDRAASKFTGKPSEVCVDGVTYLQFTSGATRKDDREGKPVPCKE